MKLMIRLLRLNNSVSGCGVTSVLHRLLLITACSLGLLSGYVQAGPCPIIYNVAVPTTLNIDPTAAVGSVLATMNLSFPKNTTCVVNASTITTYDSGNGTPVGNLYPTAIPGISYRGRVTAGWTYGLGYWPQTTVETTTSLTGVAAATVTIEFVKTGPVLPGTFPAQDIMKTVANTTSFFILHTANAIEIKPTVPSCTVTPVVTVVLDGVAKASLATTGATTGDKSFNINVNCASPTSLALSFSGTAVDTNNAIFKNTDATTGASVGVQILKDSNPVPLVAGNYISLGIVDGSVSPVFTARYYALTNSVVEGAVTSVAYATIVYN